MWRRISLGTDILTTVYTTLPRKGISHMTKVNHAFLQHFVFNVFARENNAMRDLTKIDASTGKAAHTGILYISHKKFVEYVLFTQTFKTLLNTSMCCKLIPSRQ